MVKFLRYTNYYILDYSRNFIHWIMYNLVIDL